jgi:hypothetical protein
VEWLEDRNTPSSLPLLIASAPNQAVASNSIAAPLQQAADPSDTLGANQSLKVNQSLISQNQQYEVVLQGDGNLVIYSLAGGKSTPLWASETAGKGATVAVMQGDGNFVLYNGNTPVWATGTGGNPGAYLIMQNDGNLVIYSQQKQPLWSSNTQQPPASSGTASDTLVANQSIGVNQSVQSSNGMFSLVLQGDGNLVLYRQSDMTPLWASQTNGRVVNEAVMQGDGNFVLYGPFGPVWATGTDGNPGAFLIVQNDGNVVIYNSSGTPIWSTGTQQP